MKFLIFLIPFLALGFQANAHHCRTTPWLVGIDSDSSQIKWVRDVNSPNPMEFDLTTNIYDKWAYERHEIVWRWENCYQSESFGEEEYIDRPPRPRRRPPRRPPPRRRHPRRRMCRVPHEVCRIYYQKRQERPLNQRISLSIQSGINLKDGQTENFTITYDPYNRGLFGGSTALKVDVWSWHHLYKGKTLKSSDLNPNETVEVKMEAHW